MKKTLFVALSLLGVLGFSGTAFALPYYQQTQSLVPGQDNVYNIGTTSPSLRYKTIYTTNLDISGTCIGCGGTSDAFTHPSNYGVTTSATTSPIWFQGTPYSLFASTTAVLTYASTTALSASGQIFATGGNNVTTNNFCLTSTCQTGLYANGGNASLATGGSGVTWGTLSGVLSWYPNTTAARNLGGTSNVWLNLFTTNASTTNLSISGLTSSGLAIDSNHTVYSAATTTFSSPLVYSAGNVNCPTCTVGGLTSYDAWLHQSNFGIFASATTSPIWGQAGIFASSSSAYPTFAARQSGAGPVATFDGGFVGISTSSPTNTLEVNGNLFVYNTSGTNQYPYSVISNTGYPLFNTSNLAPSNSEGLIVVNSSTQTTRGIAVTAVYNGGATNGSEQGLNAASVFGAGATGNLTNTSGGLRNRYICNNNSVGFNVLTGWCVSGLTQVSGTNASTTYGGTLVAEGPALTNGGLLFNYLGYWGQPFTSSSVGSTYGVFQDTITGTSTTDNWGLYVKSNNAYLGGSTTIFGPNDASVARTPFGTQLTAAPTAFTTRGALSGYPNVTAGDWTLDAADALGSGNSGAFHFRTGVGSVLGTIAFDASSTNQTSGVSVTTLTNSITVGAGSNMILVCLSSVNSASANRTTSVVDGATPLIKLSDGSGTGSGEGGSVWYLTAPTSGASTITATFSATANAALTCETFSNVDQTLSFGTPVVSGGSALTTGTQTTPSAAGEWVLGFLAKRSSATADNTYTPLTASQIRVAVATSTSNSTAATIALTDYTIATTTSTLTGISWTTTARGYVYTTVALNPTGSSLADTLVDRLTILPNGNVGIGTTTPWATLSVVGSTTPVLAIATSTVSGSSNPVFEIDANGHVISYGKTPIVSSCGTSPSIVGNDADMIVTVGSVVATGCTITFANVWAATPTCNVTEQTGSITNIFSYTISTSAIVVTQTGLTSDVLNIQCHEPHS